MTITALPPAPSTSDLTNFETEADAFLAALPTLATEIDAAVEAFNFNATNSTSTTSDAIALGSTTITVQASKSYVVGMAIKCAYTTDATYWMLGTVTAYDSGTGSLTFYVDVINKTGTYALWTVSQSLISLPFLTGTAKTEVHTGNGRGAVNTKCARFTTSVTDTLACYADSANNGATFTIPSSGVYSIRCQSLDTGGGISLNSNQLTTDFSTITEAHKLISMSGSANLMGGSLTTYLTAADVLRMHTGTGFTNSDAYTKVKIERLF